MSERSRFGMKSDDVDDLEEQSELCQRRVNALHMHQSKSSTGCDEPKVYYQQEWLGEKRYSGTNRGLRVRLTS